MKAACAVAGISSVRYRTQPHLPAQSRPGGELRQIFQLLLGAGIGIAVDREAAVIRASSGRLMIFGTSRAARMPRRTAR
jgi:hypothetical protein